MYSVNGKKFDSFFAAIAAAKVIRADVLESATGTRRWTPAAPAKAKKVRHVLIAADGSEKEFSRVGR